MKIKLAIIILLSSPVFSFGQFSFGIFGNLNGSSISGNAPSGMEFTNVVGFGGGFLVDYKINDEVVFSLQPSFTPRGVMVSYDLPSYKEPRDSVKSVFNYLSVPLMAKFTASKVAYVSGGIEIAFLQSAVAEYVNIPGSEDITDRITETDVFINFGVGFNFDVSDDFNVFLEGRYSQGVVNGCKFPENPGANIPKDFKNSSVQLLFGVIYDF